MLMDFVEQEQGAPGGQFRRAPPVSAELRMIPVQCAGDCRSSARLCWERANVVLADLPRTPTNTIFFFRASWTGPSNGVGLRTEWIMITLLMSKVDNDPCCS